MVRETLNTSGIYTITNQVNGKQYVGRANNFAKRFDSHKAALRRGDHHSIRLQRAYAKYGEDAFYFSILLTCDKADVKFFERRALDILKPYEVGYNCSEGVSSYMRKNNTKEHNAKISAAHKGKKYSKARCAQQSKTLQALNRGKKYTLKGKTLTIRQWAEAYGLTYNKLQHRIRYLGSLEKALDTPAGDIESALEKGREEYRDTWRVLQYGGENYSKSELARLLGINRKTVNYQIKVKGGLVEAVAYLTKTYGDLDE